MKKENLCSFSALKDRVPEYALVSSIDLVIVRYGDEVSVLYGRCPHRGALLADGHIDGKNLICGVHNWDFRYDTGVSEYNHSEKLYKFESWIEDDFVYINKSEVLEYEKKFPSTINRDDYLATYAPVSDTIEENKVAEIHELAKHKLARIGKHGASVSMGVSRVELPSWDTFQLLPAQLAKFPLLEEEVVGTDVVIGPNAKKPLHLKIPIFVSDMSFGALSEEAKVSLALGAEMAGTGICSGEGGMLPEEQESNSRYLYELASAQFGFRWELLSKVQAFHFKCGQGAKTGTGGHLPGHKNIGKISEVRNISEGKDVISPSCFPGFSSVTDFKNLAEQVREKSSGIPIGVKLSANHIEEDLAAALEVGVDYVILDGRGGGTGSAPQLFRDHISVATIPALARARKFLDDAGASHVSLVITGGLRTAPDFAKALALGADAIAVSNAAMHAIGCIAMRACHTNNCPVGIATQKKKLRSRLDVQTSAQRLSNFFEATISLMSLLAKACGYSHLSQFSKRDLTTLDFDLARMSGVRYAGISSK